MEIKYRVGFGHSVFRLNTEFGIVSVFIGSLCYGSFNDFEGVGGHIGF